MPQPKQHVVLVHTLRKLASPPGLHLDMGKDDLRLSLQRVDLRHHVCLALPALRQIGERLLVQEGDAIEVKPGGDMWEADYRRHSSGLTASLSRTLPTVSEAK